MPQKSSKDPLIITWRQKITLMKAKLADAQASWQRANRIRAEATIDMYPGVSAAAEQALNDLRACQAEAETLRAELRREFTPRT